MEPTDWRAIPAKHIEWGDNAISVIAGYKVAFLCHEPSESLRATASPRGYGAWSGLTLGDVADLGERRWLRMSGVGPKGVKLIKWIIDEAAQGRCPMKAGSGHPATDAYAPDEVATKPEVRIKPLIWEPVPKWMECSKERALAFGGEYQIVMLDPYDDPPLPSLYFEIGLGAFMFRFEQDQDPMGFPGQTCPKKFPSVKAAKAAAQADYERRILSALEDQS